MAGRKDQLYLGFYTLAVIPAGIPEECATGSFGAERTVDTGMAHTLLFLLHTFLEAMAAAGLIGLRLAQQHLLL